VSLRHKLKHELQAVALTTAYFAVWFGMLIAAKALLLAEYQIHIGKVSVALVAALVVAKVVLIMDRVPLGSWLERQPGWIDVLVRTMLYTFCALIVLMLEKAFDSRHEYGGVRESLMNVFQHRDVQHVWATVIGVGGALCGFNILAVLRRHLGEHSLIRVFFRPVPKMKGTPRPQS